LRYWVRAKRQSDASSKVHSDCVRPIGSAANSRPRVLVGGRSFYTASIRCLSNCAPSGTLAVRTLPGPNFLSIAARVIPVSRENDRFVSLVTLCFIGAAFFVLFAPAFMRPRCTALRMLSQNDYRYLILSASGRGTMCLSSPLNHDLAIYEATSYTIMRLRLDTFALSISVEVGVSGGVSQRS
jgi:hypothetical protein